MKQILIAALLATALCGARAAGPDDTLYRALGEKPGIDRIVGDFVPLLTHDERIGAAFKDTKLPELTKQLADQFCMLSGGPCAYEGASMADAHAETRIAKADFHRAVELLQQAMDGQRVPFAVQNRLLALLAPLHRDIINQR